MEVVTVSYPLGSADHTARFIVDENHVYFTAEHVGDKAHHMPIILAIGRVLGAQWTEYEQIGVKFGRGEQVRLYAHDIRDQETTPRLEQLFDFPRGMANMSAVAELRT